MRVGTRLVARAAKTALLVSLPAWTACTNFQDPTTVIDLRVLAINTEPSEVILDVDLSDLTMPVVNPASNPPIAITPLIVDPAGTPTVTLYGCPNNPFGAAPPGGGQGGGALPSGGARTTVGSTRCDPNSPLTWPLAATPISTALGEGWEVQPTVEQLTAAFRADIFPDQFGNFHGGFDLGLPFVFHLQIDSGSGETLIAIKRVMYWARPVNAAQRPNETPVIPALSTFPARDEKTFEPIGPVMPFDDGTTVDVPAGGSIWLDPSPAVAEPYETAVIDATTNLAVPQSVPRETLRYHYYATAGSFAPARTTSELPPGFVSTDRIHLESQYHAPREIPAAPVRIWVVVRDDRGGESWLQRTLQITPPPASP